MIRKKKQYVRPRQIFETERIKEENSLVKKYGLKNKKEIWKTLAKVNYYRGRAKAMAKLPIEEQEVLFNKLRALGLKTDNTADVLGLQVENLLKRRLPTVVSGKKLASTPRHARQMVVHKRILIDGQVVSSPSYIVSVAEEAKITIRKKVKKPKPKVEAKSEDKVEEKPVEKAKEEVEEEGK